MALFDYDVFLSFASEDEQVVRPIWQELSLSGLRVFWSDVSLKETVGASWHDVIERAVERSCHFILFVTPAAMASPWVKREYVAFYNHCYRPGTRRLIPVLTAGYKVSELPLFLRDIEALRMDDHDGLRRLITSIGGVDIESLKQRLKALGDENGALRDRLAAAQERMASFEEQIKQRQEPASATPVPQSAAKETEGAPRRVYLRKGVRLYERPDFSGSSAVGPVYPAGSEFEVLEINEKGYVRVQTNYPGERWIVPNEANLQDERVFFRIRGRGLVGYLVGSMYDDKSGGDIHNITIQDIVLGLTRIACSRIESIEVRKEEGRALLIVATDDGNSFEGATGNTYLFCGSAEIVLHSAQGITIDRVR